jgi:putative holliday junction resolvase
MPRYLAIDLGDKRTGLAVGDDVTQLVSPVGLIELPIDRDGGQALLRALAAACEEHLNRGDELVVGLPINMDGSEGPRALLVRQWVQRIAEHTGRKVHACDERETSEEADEQMARTGLTHGQKKQRRDALAAAAILRRFLRDNRENRENRENAPPGHS